MSVWLTLVHIIARFGFAETAKYHLQTKLSSIYFQFATNSPIKTVNINIYQNHMDVFAALLLFCLKLDVNNKWIVCQ